MESPRKPPTTSSNGLASLIKARFVGLVTAIITFWFKKGGVGKSTHAFTVGAKLAQDGYNVLMIDADSQCNLTAYALSPILEEFRTPNEYIYRTLKDEEDNKSPRTLYDALTRYEEDEPVQGAYSIPVSQWSNGGGLWILPGDDALENWEEIINREEIRIPKEFKARNFPGILHRIINLTATNLKDHRGKFTADFVIMDTNPSSSEVNRYIFMSSHFVIFPTTPDCFSVQGVDSSFKTIGRWVEKTKKTIEYSWIPSNTGRIAETPFPRHFPVLLGYIMSRYEQQKKAKFSDEDYRVVAQRKETLNDIVADSTNYVMHLIDEGFKRYFQDVSDLETPLTANPKGLNICLSKIRTFGKHGLLSQRLSIPIFLLNCENIRTIYKRPSEQRSKVAIENVKEFDDMYSVLVERVLDSIRENGFEIRESQYGASQIEKNKSIDAAMMLLEMPLRRDEKIKKGKKPAPPSDSEEIRPLVQLQIAHKSPPKTHKRLRKNNEK